MTKASTPFRSGRNDGRNAAAADDGRNDRAATDDGWNRAAKSGDTSLTSLCFYFYIFF